MKKEVEMTVKCCDCERLFTVIRDQFIRSTTNFCPKCNGRLRSFNGESKQPRKQAIDYLHEHIMDMIESTERRLEGCGGDDFSARNSKARLKDELAWWRKFEGCIQSARDRYKLDSQLDP